jgi:hypothetical protein
MKKFLMPLAFTAISICCAFGYTSIEKLTNPSWRDAWKAKERELVSEKATMSTYRDMFIEYAMTRNDANAATRLIAQRISRSMGADNPDADTLFDTFFQKMDEAGDDAKLMRALQLVLEERKSDEAYEILKPLSDAGNTEAMDYMLLACEYGFVEKDETARLNILEKRLDAKSRSAFEIAVSQLTKNNYSKKLIGIIEKKSGKFEDAPLVLAQYYKNEKQPETALKWAEKSLDSKDGRIIAYTFLLLDDLYTANAMPPEKVKEKLSAMIDKIDDTALRGKIYFVLSAPKHDHCEHECDGSHEAGFDTYWLDLAAKEKNPEALKVKVRETGKLQDTQ